MKQALTLIGLVALSILYLLEVDYGNITVYNWIAFAIIALTLVPLAVYLISRAVNCYRAHQEAAERKEAEKQRRSEEKEGRK